MSIREKTSAAEPEYLSVKEAAVRLGVSASTIRLWTNAGRLASTRTLGGHRRIHVSEIARLQRYTMEDYKRDVSHEDD